jgi:hypothetical protein
MQQLRVRVSWLTEIKLKDKLGKCKTDDRGSRGVGVIVPDPRTRDGDPSAKVTVEVEAYDLKVEKRPELPVI